MLNAHKKCTAAAFLSVLVRLLTGVYWWAGEHGTRAVTADQQAPRNPENKPPSKAVLKAAFRKATEASDWRQPVAMPAVCPQIGSDAQASPAIHKMG